MPARRTPVDNFRQLAAKTRGDVDFARALSEQSSLDDEKLAELIEADGRIRLARGKSVTIERYLDVVPDLIHRPLSLDAAIDITLRALSRASRADPQAIEALVTRFPQLERPIREAAVLNNALLSTNTLRNDVAGRVDRDLPQNFGPPTMSGLPRYELRKLLGSGASGQVFLAVDRQLSDDDHAALVAIKILAAAGRTEESRRLLAEEAMKARRVDHPNVVRVLDRGVSSDDEDYVVYEYVEGGDLGQWLTQRDSPVSVREAAQIIAQVARGLQAAHSAGLVHCDLKPENIMLTSDGRPKVADFGIAIRFGESLATLQNAGRDRHPIGNLAFISPEQYRMDADGLNVPSDVYALGGILFFMLTGMLPNGSTLEEIRQTHDPDAGRSGAPSSRTLRPEVDRDLDAICRRAMAPKPEERYSAAGAMAEDLEAWIRREPIYWTRPPLRRMFALWVRRRPASAAILGVLALTLVTAIAVGYYLSEEAREADRQRELERVRADEEARQTAKTRERAYRMVETLYHSAEQGRSVTEILPMAWTIQNIYENEVMAIPDDLTTLADVRLRAIENLLEGARAEGRSRDLEIKLWETNYAFWQIARGNVEKAESILEQLKRDWHQMLAPDDRWLDLIDAMIACAAVRRLASAGGARASSAEDLAILEARLLQHEAALSRTDRASPQHLLILQVLGELYCETMLDQPQRRDGFAARYAELAELDRVRERREVVRRLRDEEKALPGRAAPR